MAEVKPAGRTYGGQTAEQRLEDRRTALLDAALELIAEDGVGELRIDGVCRRAGLNKRYFYAAFDGVDALVGALLERLATDAIDAALAHADHAEPRATTIRRTLAAFIAHLTDDPRRARVLFGAVAATDAAADHRTRAIHRVIGAVVDEGQQLHPGMDGALTATIAAVLVGGTSQAVLDWLDGDIDAPREALVAHLTALWLAVDDVAAEHARVS